MRDDPSDVQVYGDDGLVAAAIAAQQSDTADEKAGDADDGDDNDDPAGLYTRPVDSLPPVHRVLSVEEARAMYADALSPNCVTVQLRGQTLANAVDGVAARELRLRVGVTVVHADDCVAPRWVEGIVHGFTKLQGGKFNRKFAAQKMPNAVLRSWARSGAFGWNDAVDMQTYYANAEATNSAFPLTEAAVLHAVSCALECRTPTGLVRVAPLFAYTNGVQPEAMGVRHTAAQLRDGSRAPLHALAAERRCRR